VAFPSNNQNVTLSGDLTLSARNKVRINQDLVNLNGHKLFIKATSVDFTGQNQISGLTSFLDENNIFTLPGGASPTYEGGWLSGFCTGYCELDGQDFAGFTLNCQTLPNFGGYKFDFRQLGLDGREAKPVSKPYLEDFCRNKYDPYVTVSGLIANDENLDDDYDNILAFPNPMTNSSTLGIRISSVVQDSDVEIDVRNLLGQSIYHKRTYVGSFGNSLQIDISDAEFWQPGSYYIVVKTQGQPT
jgi:hypothetical protein